MHTILLLHLLSLFASVTAFNVPQAWMVGLRTDQTPEEHLSTVGQHIDITHYIPKINGYAITPSASDEAVLPSIRHDPGVGFIVQKPEGFFSEEYRIGLAGYELEAYEDERSCLMLQGQDPEITVTDDGAM